MINAPEGQYAGLLIQKTMQAEIVEILSSLKFRLFSGDEEKKIIQEKPLPADYLEFMSLHDGGTGFIGKNENYIDLWTAMNVNDLNPYLDNDFAKSILIIGSDGSGTLYGYDPASNNFFEADEYELTKNGIRERGSSFLEFMTYLANK